MLKTLLYILSTNALAIVIKTVSGVLFPRYMTTQAYAEYQTFSLYISYLPVLCLGFPAGLFVRYGGQPFETIDKAGFKSANRLLFCILTAFFFLFLVFLTIWPSRMLLGITICIIPYCLVCSYQSLYQAWGDFGKSNRTQLLTAVVPVLGSFAVFLLSGELEAESFIVLFLGVYWLLALGILIKNASVTAGVEAPSPFCKINLDIWKTGIAVSVGSYIHVVIRSLDKQIVKLLFDTTDFAMYSFALSLQSVVMLFITAISQPLYHFLAKGQFDREDYPVLMRCLLMLGACGGVAYHGCGWIVSDILPDYAPSLQIAAIYFLAFPPMAVIYGLYVNLYKLHRHTKVYVIRSAGVLALSLLVNALLLVCRMEVMAVAAATVSVNYIWFFADSRFFRQVRISVKDILFMAGFVGGYLLSLRISAPLPAAAGYCLWLGLLCITVYRREVFGYLLKRNPGM